MRARRPGSRIGCAPAAPAQPSTNAKNAKIATKTGAPAIHQLRPRRPARPTAIAIAAITEIAVAPSDAHCAESHAPTWNGPRPQWCSHQSSAMLNGSETNQSVASTTIPTTIALLTRPSPMPRTTRGIRRARIHSATSGAIVASSQRTRSPRLKLRARASSCAER